MAECLIDLFVLPHPTCNEMGITIKTDRGMVCKVLTHDPRDIITPATGEYPYLTSCNIGEASKRVLANPGFKYQPLGLVTGIPQ